MEGGEVAEGEEASYFSSQNVNKKLSLNTAPACSRCLTEESGEGAGRLQDHRDSQQ